MELAGKRVLVTGGHGFLGSHVVEKLKEKGATVYSPHSTHYDLRWIENARSVIQEAQVVVHCAAKCGGIGANAVYPADFFYDNLIMGANLIEVCADSSVEKLVLIGTTCSYPKDAPLPLKEDDLWSGYPEPTNAPYGIAKRTLLTMAQAYHQQYGLNFCYLIPANLYGPRDNFDLETGHVIPAIIRKCVEAVTQGQETVSLWGDGTPTREFLYVEDCAEAIVKAAEVYAGVQPLNLGTGQDWSIQAIARMISDATGFDGEFVWDTTKPNGQQSRVLFTKRMNEILEWEPKTGIVDGICRTVAWYLSQVTRPYSEGMPMEARLSD